MIDHPMPRGREYASHYPGFVDPLLDNDGRPPCDPKADACPTCRLFDVQRPGETRRGWLARITGTVQP